ncbi:MAG TPA: hypothetical protein ENG87_00295 [Candidatus Pacearchaeota archaeon]|nr:hypothetical protein BMS3Abin17_00403 [archaeon BMS3Abin17]HDK41789.1 hypothetical protein [Candidatus Pacearchaeota archaeon]HDZ60265.1 hypothetical protein [Candidatus Pacearchaeota archaeon]
MKLEGECPFKRIQKYKRYLPFNISSRGTIDNPEVKIEIDYDWKFYQELAHNLRLAEAPKLKSLDEPERGSFTNQRVGPEYIFTNREVFDTKHLGLILRVHAPLKASHYFEETKENILSLTFYKKD